MVLWASRPSWARFTQLFRLEDSESEWAVELALKLRWGDVEPTVKRPYLGIWDWRVGQIEGNKYLLLARSSRKGQYLIRMFVCNSALLSFVQNKVLCAHVDQGLYE